MPGVGNLTAWHLEAFLPELGRCAHQSLAALVGGAPFNHDSGKHQGERFMQGGRARGLAFGLICWLTCVCGFVHLKAPCWEVLR
ncbi:transposase [Candidatus Glomeribacter gigasporarum]|uniref:transposase n=1 Tax=Candidatus Glomeribacter gigasporarum TaxID=132144 RepID=UPI003B9689FC